MNKKLIPIALMFGFLILAGQQCQQEDGVLSTVAFVGGVQGLTMSFTEGSPPSEVFDEGRFPFSVNLKLENRGEWDINKENVRIEITGVDPADFDLSTSDLVKNPTSNMAGTKIDSQGKIIPGSLTYLDFSGFNYNKEVPAAIELPLEARACYQYGTIAVSELCILKDLLGRTPGRKFCEINSIKSIQNSGAPVQVSNFEQRAIESDKVRFNFLIRHSGFGSLSQKGSNCNPDYVTRDKVQVIVDTGITGALSCSGFDSGSGFSGTTTLYNGERLITCTQQISTLADYTKIPKITLEYDYQDTIPTLLTVRHLG